MTEFSMNILRPFQTVIFEKRDPSD